MIAVRRASLAVLIGPVVIGPVVIGLTPARLAQGQDSPQASASSSAESDEAARRAILDSERWRQMLRSWNEWLAVQRIYAQDEAEAMRAEFAARAASVSARELGELLQEMEEKLRVLLSPEADEARRWVAQFLSVARNAEEQIRNKRPDVTNMTASQIQQELERFHGQQAATRQAQNAFDRTRGQQVQAALGAQAATRQARTQAQEQRSQAVAAAQLRSRYAPPPRSLPNFTDPDAAAAQNALRPYFTISPWGTPVRWNPLNEWW